MTHGRLTLVAGAVGVALVVGMATPAWGGDGSSPNDGGSAVVGSFGIGDGLEAVVDERDGAVRLSVPVAGLTLSWDSRAAAVDRYGFGGGWGPGLAQIDTRGGVRVLGTSGRVHEADDTHPSGLAGYGAGDLRFEQRPGVLPARADGAAGEIAYAFVLHELGGTATYFNEDGDPVVRTSGLDERVDWRWDPSTAHRLTGVVSPDGVLTALDWEDPGVVLVQPAANLGDAVRAQAGVWRVELDGGRVSAVRDPLGGRTSVGMDGDGLIDRLAAESGATTTVSWQRTSDGVPRAEQLTTADAAGAPLSTRSWRALDARTASGWPGFDATSAGSTWEYTTELSDGQTAVRSTYSSLHTLGHRELIVTTPSGEHEITATTFAYDGNDGVDPTQPATLPANWSRPVEATRTFTDLQGGSRVETESFTYDQHGRAVRQVGVDGTETLIGYGPDPADGSLPTAFPIVETTRAADGSVSEARHTLHPSGAAVLASETRTGTDGSAGVLVERTEWQIEDDGFVSEERVFHADDPDPAITRWQRSTDLPAGRQRVTETVAAGSAAQTTTSEVRSLVHAGVLEEVDPLGSTTSAEYDALGRVTTVTDVSGRTVHTGYTTARTGGENTTIVTGPDGVTETETRDAIGRVVQLHDDIADGEAPTPGHVRVIETREYPDPATVEVTDAWGATSIARQDPLGRTVQQVAANGLTKLFVHDDVANTTTTALTPTGRLADAELTTVERRDAAGNVVGSHGSRRDGAPVPETRSEFDGFGRMTHTTNGTLESRVEHDALGNPTLSTLAPADAAASDSEDEPAAADGTDPERTSPIESIRRFDARGNSLEKTLRSGDEARSGGSRTLDELGRVVTKTDQLGRTTTIEYTPDGLESRVVHGNGQVAEATYDPITREPVRTRVSAPGRADVTTEYRYDPVTGRLNAVLDPNHPDDSLIEYEWNALGLLVQTRYPDGSTVRHEYDDHGRKLATIDAAGARTEYAYDGTGALIGAVQRDADGDERTRVDYSRDELGRIARVERGNGVVTETTYTSVNQIATEQTTGPHGPISERRYEYDTDGNLTSRVDITHPPGTDTDTGAIERTTTVYEYDAYRRLTASAIYDGETAEGDPFMRTAYDLTVSGDIARETTTTSDQGEPRTTVREFAYSVLGELDVITTTDPAGVTATATQDYDDAGNLVRAHDGATTAFDAANRPIQHVAADGGTRDTTYWADGTRRALTTTAPDGARATTTFAWDDGVLLTERHSGAAPAQASYLLGADRHARVVQHADTAPATIEYHGTDRHSNVTDLTGEAGDLTARFAYSDAGVRATTTIDAPAPDRPHTPANPFGYAGEYTHDDGSQHLSTRIYDPDTMRFASMDTEELHNAYAYADLNPITKVDPEGTNALADANNIILSVFGVFMAVAAAVMMWHQAPVFIPLAIADLSLAVIEVLDVAKVITLDQADARTLAGITIGAGAAMGLGAFGYYVVKGPVSYYGGWFKMFRAITGRTKDRPVEYVGLTKQYMTAPANSKGNEWLTVPSKHRGDRSAFVDAQRAGRWLVHQRFRETKHAVFQERSSKLLAKIETHLDDRNRTSLSGKRLPSSLFSEQLTYTKWAVESAQRHVGTGFAGRASAFQQQLLRNAEKLANRSASIRTRSAQPHTSGSLLEYLDDSVQNAILEDVANELDELAGILRKLF